VTFRAEGYSAFPNSGHATRRYLSATSSHGLGGAFRLTFPKEFTMNLPINRYTSEEFRAKRYEDADEIPPLTSHPVKNRLSVGEIEAAWSSTGWRDPLEGVYVDVLVKRQEHNVYLYKLGQPVGKAKFVGYWIRQNVHPDTLIEAAHLVSSELYEFISGLKEVGEALERAYGLLGEGFYLYEGMRIVEFKMLVMRESHARNSEWLPAINEFIKRKFTGNLSRWYYALILQAFPLEYEANHSGLEPPASKCGDTLLHRRRAMTRHYKKTLGVELLTKSNLFDSERWWMGREL
jgi:hypothetical protein